MQKMWQSDNRMTGLKEKLLKQQMSSLQNLKNLGDFINKLSIIIKAAKPLLKKEGYEIEILKMTYKRTYWDAILIRKLEE